MPALNTKTEDTSPTSDDLLYTLNDPAGTPADRKVTAGNLIKKAHGLSDGLMKVASGVMAIATAGTDYYNPGGTDVSIADGGTGQSTKSAAFNALSPMTTVGDLIIGGASGSGSRFPMGTPLQLIRVKADGSTLEYYTPVSGSTTPGYVYMAQAHSLNSLNY